jgi:4-carboxymuconolactone decarboxylase
MSRLEPRPIESFTPEQREQYERIRKMREPGANGQFGGPFDPWIMSPEVAQRAVSFGNFLWNRTTVGRRIVELCICVTGRFWESNVEWVAHSRMAKDSGVAQETLDDIFALRRPANAPEDEQLAYDVSKALHESHQLPRELYDRAVATWGEQGLVEIVATIGYYTMVAMTLAAFEVDPEGVDPLPFPRG